MADDPATKPKEQAKFIWEKRRKDSDDLPTTWAGQSKTTQLKRVLLYTRRLIVTDSPTDMQRSTVVKSVQDTVLTGDAELKLYVNKCMSTEDEALLQLSPFDSYQYLISILAPLCPAVEQLSIVFCGMRLQQLIHKPLPMRSVITVCIKSLYCSRTLCETLLSVTKYFPNAESVDLQLLNLHLYNKANIPELNSSSSMRELKLRYKGSLLDGEATERVFLDISTSCPNIVSLVLSGFEQYLLSKSGKDIKSYKLPNLTNIHLEPFGMDDSCRFETFTNILLVVYVTSPRLKLIEAKKVQLGDAELISVKWSRTSSGCELQLEGASAAVPVADLMHRVSNELKGVTVLTFDKCKVDFPESISHPPQSTGEESLLRELKFLNVECPLSQTDISKLSEMYPNVKVTVENESQASHEDSEQGTMMPFKPEWKTSPSSPHSSTSSIEELVGPTASVQVNEEQTDTHNTEKEGKKEKKEEEEEEEYYSAMESLPHETDELVGATARVQVHEEQRDTQNTEEEEDHIAIESLPHETEELVGPTARVQVYEEQTDTHNTEKEGKKEKKEEEEEEEYYSAMESLPHETDELVGATARVQVHEEQTDTQSTEEEEDHIAMESLPHETDEVNVRPIKMECCKRVGVEGGKLQLDSFGIELEIPPGAIDSEVPQDISLRVLTDTSNLGNNKEEMSVCFGVQCLAPDDLVLKLPVTYTIPHCAVITGTRYSSVKAVLYTGEGEYSPDAVVKERSILSTSGIPSCTITKDVLKLKMNHFSWAKIMLRIKNVIFKGKKMCCRPFKKKNLAMQKTPVILHAHLYDAITGNSKLVKSQEADHEFVPAHMELKVLIHKTEGDLKMICSVNEKVIGRHAVVTVVKLMSGTGICEPFQLDFTNQPDIVAVLLKVGQIENLQVKFLFELDFSTPHTAKGASPKDQEQPQGASSSQILQILHRSTGETPENISGRQEDFDDKLTTVARKVGRRDEIDNLGKALGFEPEDIQRYVDTNMKTSEVSYMGTLSMLRAWRNKQTEITECKALKGVLRKAGQIRLVYELFGTS